MRTLGQLQSEPKADRLGGNKEWARIDPMIYVTEARRQQARAVAEALGAARRGLRQGLSALAGRGRRLLDRLARRSERRWAIAQLSRLDDRLLVDIGLRRSDIELAVDGLLADPRVTRRAATPAAATAERPREGERRPLPAGVANANRPALPAPPDRVADLAA